MYDRLIHQLTSHDPNFRYERKFVNETMGPGEMTAWLSCHPYGFYRAYPDRQVNNGYFDTPDQQFFYDNARGTRDRLKVRVRWYGDMNAVRDPYLEIKIRRGECGYKRRYALPEFTFAAMNSAAAWSDVFAQAQLPEELSEYLQGLELTLINRYHRAYFQSRDQRFRATVDTDMRFYPHVAAAGRDRSRSLLGDDQVLEVKYGQDAAVEASRVTNAWPLRLSRHSKYVRGMEWVALSAAFI